MQTIGGLKMEKYLRELISDIQDYGCDVSDGKKKVSNKTLVDHLMLHGVGVIPAIPGRQRDDWGVDERIFRNGEMRMKDLVVDMLVGIRTDARDSQEETLITEIISKVRLL
jgi:hypothetical protein